MIQSPRMNSTTDKRIIYVEDAAKWRRYYGQVLQRGLGPNVTVEAHEDFTPLREHINGQASLADCYIFDNEIAGSSTQGADIARAVHESALQREHEVLIITMLSSAPELISRKHGEEFKERGIPILEKTVQAPICFMLVGASIGAGRRLDLNSWMEEQGIRMPDPSVRGAEDVREGIFDAVLQASEGGLYLPPLEFARKNEAVITRYMSPDGIREFGRTFPLNPQIEGSPMGTRR